MPSLEPALSFVDTDGKPVANCPEIQVHDEDDNAVGVDENKFTKKKVVRKPVIRIKMVGPLGYGSGSGIGTKVKDMRHPAFSSSSSQHSLSSTANFPSLAGVGGVGSGMGMGMGM